MKHGCIKYRALCLVQIELSGQRGVNIKLNAVPPAAHPFTSEFVTLDSAWVHMNRTVRVERNVPAAFRVARWSRYKVLGFSKGANRGSPVCTVTPSPGSEVIEMELNLSVDVDAFEDTADQQVWLHYSHAKRRQVPLGRWKLSTQLSS